jgi:hypothetical protein
MDSAPGLRGAHDRYSLDNGTWNAITPLTPSASTGAMTVRSRGLHNNDAQTVYIVHAQMLDFFPGPQAVAYVPAKLVGRIPTLCPVLMYN